MLQIDAVGLDEIDRKILMTIIEKVQRWSRRAGHTGCLYRRREYTTIEDVYEPFLLQLGFIARTPAGKGCHLTGLPSSAYTLPGTGETDIVESIEFNQKINRKDRVTNYSLKVADFDYELPEGADSPASC
jgi:hypothetical protein